MASLRNELGLGETGRRFPKKGTCAAIYSRVVNTQTTLSEVLETAFPWCAEDLDGLGELFAAYVDRKEVQHCLDFDDLLVFWEALLDEGQAYGLQVAGAERLGEVVTVGGGGEEGQS